MRSRPIARGLAATTLIGGLLTGGVAVGTASAAPVRPAAAAPPTAATLSTLSLTFPAGSGGSVSLPLGISVFNGKVYVSDTGENVLARLAGTTTTTVAGSLEGIGENGDGGPASKATLDQESGTAEDTSGNIYIADTEDNVIRKINVHTGLISRLAGTGAPGKSGLGGQATRAQLNSPQDVAVNRQGDVFVADTFNNRVDEILPNGKLVAFAGNGKPGFSGDGKLATGAELAGPTGVAVDAQGNVYIADAGNSLVRRVAAKTGIITTVAGDFKADQANDGLGGFSGDGGPATSAQLNAPEAVALDSAGDLFIADTLNNAVREVTPAGTISTVVNAANAPNRGSETAGPATASGLNGPSAIAVGRTTDTVYIADTSNNAAAAVSGLAKSGFHSGPVAP